jgi:hypothetical protein
MFQSSFNGGDITLSKQSVSYKSTQGFSFVLMDRAELFSESLTKEGRFQRKSTVVEIGKLEEGYA